ncbi:response regulator [Massilia sp. Se16.2.3]|uniref:response regulator n=1 Tax=Massilia sp. Se16.2.3 TaxID=2709303 RepID=UPI0035A57D4E
MAARSRCTARGRGAGRASRSSCRRWRRARRRRHRPRPARGHGNVRRAAAAHPAGGRQRRRRRHPGCPAGRGRPPGRHDQRPLPVQDAALAAPPDVFILDIGMPGIDGHELARRLRTAPALQVARYVALTGYGQSSDLESSRQAGFDHHFVKPVDAAALIAALAEIAP